MDDVTRELRRLKGVGEVLAGRLVSAGMDSLEKIVAAGEEGLKAIKGINPRAIPVILSQAAAMSSDASERRLGELRERTAAMGLRVQTMAADVKSRFGEELAGKDGRKVERDLLRIAGSLDTVAVLLEKRRKRAWKVLSKFEKRLSALEGAGLKEIRKGLKKTRKMLLRTGFMEKAGKQRV